MTTASQAAGLALEARQIATSAGSFSDQDLLFSANFRKRTCLALTDWPLTITRSGNANVTDALLYIHQVEADRPRITHDKDTGESLGLLVESATTNLVQSPTHAGASVTTVSGNSGLPTGWVSGFSGTGITLQVTAVNANTITLRFVGDGSQSAATRYIQFGANATFAVNSGDTATVSANLRLSAGAIGACTIHPGFLERNASAVIQVLNPGYTPDAPDATDFIYEYTDTIGYTGYLCGGLILTNTTAAFDFSIEISREQVEIKSYRTSYFAGSRSADVVQVSSPTTYLARARWSLEIEARAPQNTPIATLFQWDDGTNSNRLMAYISGYRLKVDSTVSGVTTTTTLGYWIPLMDGRLTASVSGGIITLSYNGASVQTAVIPAGLTRWLIGSGNYGYWEGAIVSLSAWATAYASADVVKRARTGLYDDFNRADGAIGAATTGQRYTTYRDSGTSTRSTMAISGGRAVAPLSGQSTSFAYTGFDLGSTIKAIGVAYNCPVDGAKAVGVATMAFTPSGLGDVTQITVGPAAHPSAGNQLVTLGYYANSSLTGQPNGSGWYSGTTSAPLTLSTGTDYFFSARVFGNYLLARAPDGRLRRGYNTGFASVQSRFGLFETSVGNTNSVLPQFLAVRADAA